MDPFLVICGVVCIVVLAVSVGHLIFRLWPRVERTLYPEPDFNDADTGEFEPGEEDEGFDVEGACEDLADAAEGLLGAAAGAAVVAAEQVNPPEPAPEPEPKTTTETHSSGGDYGGGGSYSDCGGGGGGSDCGGGGGDD